MACWDSFEIIASNDDDFDVQGFIHCDYPGCGYCTNCYNEAFGDLTKLKELQEKSEAWYVINNKKFICNWKNEKGFEGTFTFRCESKDKARKVIAKSIYDWVTIEILEDPDT